MLQVLIVDNYAVVRSALSLLLKTHFSDIEPIEASSLEDIIQQIQSKPVFGLLIISDNFKEIPTDQLLKRIKQLIPDTRILLLADHFDYYQGLAYLQNGATAYITKYATEHEIETAIRHQLDDKPYFAPEMLMALAMEKLSSLKIKHFSHKAIAQNPFRQLSAHDQQIVIHIANGSSNKTIAHLFKLRSSTISMYKTRILRRLRVNNVQELRQLLNRLMIPY